MPGKAARHWVLLEPEAEKLPPWKGSTLVCVAGARATSGPSYVGERWHGWLSRWPTLQGPWSHGSEEKAYRTASTPLCGGAQLCGVWGSWLCHCHLSQALDKVHSRQTLEEAEPCRNLVWERLWRAEQWRKPKFSGVLVSELKQKQEEKTLSSSVSLQHLLFIRFYILLAGK